MMFAFAGLELSSMVAGRTKNPQKDFPKAILSSAIIIVFIYVILTFCMNIIYPADKTSILDGFSQAVGFVCSFFGFKYILEILEICIFLGVIGQVNSWLVGPMYMLKTASSEPIIKGDKLAKLHPKYKTPYIALIIQAVFVCILCLLIVLDDSLEQIYWSMISLTTLCYFIPYLIIFPTFLKLKYKNISQHMGFSIPGRLLPICISVIGFSSVMFAIILTLIPPIQLDISGFFSTFWYVASMLFGVFLSFGFALLTLKKGEKL